MENTRAAVETKTSGIRARQIKEITFKRKPLAQRVAVVLTNVARLRQALISLNPLILEIATAIEGENAASQFRALGSEIPALANRLAQEELALSFIKTRFDRETLNVGVVGMAGQGKSRLLQSLSGLTATEIPDGKLGHCTGAACTILNQSVDAPYGEIVFHTPQSFLDEVIGPFFTGLELGTPPVDLATFANTKLPPLPEKLRNSIDGATHQAHYDRLRNKYLRNTEAYRQYLGAPPLRVERSAIRSYVAQRDGSGVEIYNYMAVREARIFCEFPLSDVRDLALVDMPGLGDFQLDAEKRMIETLGEKVDIILFIRRPEPIERGFSPKDTRLWGVASQAIRRPPVERWSFLVLNKTARESDVGSNHEAVDFLEGDLNREAIKVIQCLKADCADVSEANEVVLNKVVNYLLGHIEELDAEYASDRQAMLDEACAGVRSLVERAGMIVKSKSIAAGDFALYQKLFSSTWESTRHELAKLVRHYRERRDQPNEAFVESLGKVLSNAGADPRIPSPEQIERRAALVGVKALFPELLHEVRGHLCKHFVQLDESLTQYTCKMRDEVGTVLREQGMLKNVEASTGEAWWAKMTKLIEEDEGSLPNLARAFETFAGFHLAYRGLLQHRFRQYLDELHPETAKGLTGTLPPGCSPVDAREALEIAHEEACSKVRNDFHSFNSEPNLALFAILEEFIDLAFLAEGARAEWERLYEQNKGDMWPEQFGKLEENSRLRARWEQQRSSLTELYTGRAMRFLGSDQVEAV